MATLPIWRRVLNPAKTFCSHLLRLLFRTQGGAAVITVVLGGLIAASITNTFQRNLKERELQLLDAQEYSRERIASAKEIYDLTGNALAIAREALSLAEQEFQPSNALSAEERHELLSHRARIVQDYNRFIREWNARRETIGLLLLYYYPQNPDIVESWGAVELAANDYLSCSIRAQDDSGLQECIVRYEKLANKLEALTKELVAEWQTASENRESR